MIAQEHEIRSLQRQLKDESEGVIEDLTAGLSQLFDIQNTVSSIQDGAIAGPGEYIDSRTIATYAFSMVAEVCELATEMQFKPWKPKKTVDPARIADEFADCLAFMGIMLNHVMSIAGVEPRDIAEQYVRKSLVNIERQSGRMKGWEHVDRTGHTLPKQIPGQLELQPANQNPSSAREPLHLVNGAPPPSEHPPKEQDVAHGRPLVNVDSADEHIVGDDVLTALAELGEIGSRSNGPFTDELVSGNPRIRAIMLKLLPSYTGRSRYARAMREVLERDGTLSSKQVRACANILFDEADPAAASRARQTARS